MSNFVFFTTQLPATKVALKRKVRELESRKEYGCEVKRERSERQPYGNSCSGEFQVCDTQSGEMGAVARFSGSEVDVCQLEDREMKPADDPRSPVTNTNEQNSHMTPQIQTGSTKEEEPESVCIKEEMLEDDLDVKDQGDKVEITGDTIETKSPKSDEESTEHNSRNGVWEASEQGGSFKEEMEKETNGQLMEAKGHVGELSDLDAVPSHRIKEEESQNPICRYKSENLAGCTEAQMFCSNDKYSILAGVHTQHGEDTETEAFVLGNITVFPSNSHMMGEDTASKCNVPYVTSQVSDEDHLAMISSVRRYRRGRARDRQFICTYCGKGLGCRRDLKDHQRVHTGEKPFTCTQCGKSFGKSSMLTAHLWTHTDEKPFTCTQCGKGFAHLSKFKIHQRVHTGEKPFTCTQCGKSFSVLSSLKLHQRVHSGEKPFTCTECGKSFSASTTLKQHQIVHTGERRYLCTYCGKHFGQSSALTVHLRTHTGEKPFTCSQCGKSYRRSSSLSVHLRTHTGVKPFTCTQCGKSFAVLSTYKTHQRVHTGEKPFSCTQCGKNFRQSSGLTVHLRTHTVEKPLT